MEKEFDLEDLELDYTVVYVKYSKYSKEYAYLIDDFVKVGSKVYVQGKDEPLEVIRIEVLPESKLPIEYSKMKYAFANQPIEYKISKLLQDNPVLKMVNGNKRIIGRDDVLDELEASLYKRRMRNSLLIGEAGCGKTSIVEALVPILEDYIILGFNVGELVAGTTLRGMLEEKLTKIFNDILTFNIANKIKIILFIDEFHMIVSNAGCSECVSMHDILKPYLTNPNIIVIGATTITEYNNYIKKDFALKRRITPIYVNNLNDNEVLKILDNFSNHKVDHKLLTYILNGTKDIKNTTNPDISLEVLDRILAKNEALGYEIDNNLINKEINKLKESYEMI